MLFNSLAFAIFLPIVFSIYWFVFPKKYKIQNLLLLIASYLFYGWWDWRFLSLLFISSIVDYIIGIQLNEIKDQRRKNALLSISLLFNLGFLGIFKYFNFFADSLIDLLAYFQIAIDVTTLSIILPVGISFYTFQNLSYTIDIHKGKLEPTRDVIAYFAFACFFPQLVAGPIERAAALLPQFTQARTFNYIKARDGLQQILWGMVKKVCVADIIAPQVNHIFNDYANLSGSTLILGAVFFSIQIYGDFSGYSDIAIGTAKLFDIDLMTNFRSPYFSRSVREFWRRWHISLSTWFRDYLYFPLGGSRNSKWQTARNLLITFTVSGLWHGANWTFVFWGFLNGLYMVPPVIFPNSKLFRNDVDQSGAGTFRSVIQAITTYILITFTWIFFRADNIQIAFQYIKGIFSGGIFNLPEGSYLLYLVPIFILLVIELISFKDDYPWKRVNHMPQPVRWAIYIIAAILVITSYQQATAFIYFQF